MKKYISLSCSVLALRTFPTEVVQLCFRNACSKIAVSLQQATSEGSVSVCIMRRPGRPFNNTKARFISKFFQNRKYLVWNWNWKRNVKDYSQSNFSLRSAGHSLNSFVSRLSQLRQRVSPLELATGVTQLKKIRDSLQTKKNMFFLSLYLLHLSYGDK